ncbi:MAG: hypothetical protein JWO96_130 [Candidatus Saccharibacteria bacterium]|nr:hypothetical protein [Candidatus Saccharibacteria bacterium]
MSKHSNGEAKLHIGKEVRTRNRPANQRPDINGRASQVPPKGTNANNQYR